MPLAPSPPSIVSQEPPLPGDRDSLGNPDGLRSLSLDVLDFKDFEDAENIALPGPVRKARALLSRVLAWDGVLLVVLTGMVASLALYVLWPAPDLELQVVTLPPLPASQAVLPVSQELAADPERPAPGRPKKSAQKPAVPSGPVFLNAATAAQLDSLPAVGPKTAQRILQHRQKIGGFRTVEQLLDVPGIGPKKLDKMRPYVRV